MCLLSPLSAFLMNRYGRKPVMMAGCFFEVSAYYLLTFLGYRYVNFCAYRLSRRFKRLYCDELYLQVHRRFRKLLSQLFNFCYYFFCFRREYEHHDWFIVGFHEHRNALWTYNWFYALRSRRIPMSFLCRRCPITGSYGLLKFPLKERI